MIDVVIYMVIREKYLKRMIDAKDTEFIKVITGVRRSGKSTLLLMFKDYLVHHHVKEENIIYINFESAMYDDIKNYKDLYQYIQKRIKDSKVYLLLDEVQNVEAWEKAINSFKVDFDIDIYITGSNAYLLSGELATLLSGRYIEIKMLPLSFREYVTAFDEDNYYQLFLNYMKNGGMPGEIDILKSNPDGVDKYLDGIFSTIVYKDIMARKNIVDKMLLESILKFIFDSVGSSVSPKKISDTLTSKGISTSNHTVDHYINAFLESFLIYKAERFDVKGKNLLAREYKFYVVDTGLRSYLLGKKADRDMGNILKNIVYLELIRRGYKVYVGKVDDGEIDFVAQNREGLKYYQVALTVRDDLVLERELKSLQKTGDYYPKYLLTLDMDLNADYDGIKKINVVDWLLGEE